MRHLDISSKEYVLHFDRWTWDDQTDKIAQELPKNIPGDIRDVRFTHTQTQTCLNREECTIVLRELLTKDVKLGLQDIRYNFLVSSSGAVYEGRGWNYMPSSHPLLRPARPNTIDVAYIGTFEEGQLPLNMIVTGLNLIKYGIKMNFMEPSCNIGYYKPPRIAESVQQRGLTSVNRRGTSYDPDASLQSED